MSCYHPLKGFVIGKTAAGKDKYKICSYNTDHVEVLDNGEIVVSDSPGCWPFGVKRVVRDFVQIPCGRCIGCRIDYSRAWADRCMLEMMDHESNYFLTLTYNDESLEKLRKKGVNPETGEVTNFASLDLKDLQKFHKDLRKSLDNNGKPKIRMFACGEYGSPEQTFRPHFHDIVFGLVVDDLKYYRYTRNGDILWTSDYLNSIWKKGFVVVGQVTYKSAAYVARYVTKKLKGQDSEVYQALNIKPPFVVMSRKPGIARKYYEEHPDLFDYKSIYVAADDGSHQIYPGRYFKHLLEADDPERFLELKEVNKRSGDLRNENKLEQTDLDYLSLLKVEEAAFQNRIKTLQRKERLGDILASPGSLNL